MTLEALIFPRENRLRSVWLFIALIAIDSLLAAGAWFDVGFIF